MKFCSGVLTLSINQKVSCKCHGFINILLRVPSFEISTDILLVFLYLVPLKAHQIFLMLTKMSAAIPKEDTY